MTINPRKRMAEYLNERGVSLKYAEEAGLRPADAWEARKFGLPYAQPGILIPYLNPWKHDSSIGLIRIRYFDSPFDKDGREVKFAQPRGSGVEAYFAPHVNWGKVAEDPSISICFVEGEVKALAMNQRGIITIGLGGVDMFGGDDLTPWLRGIMA